MTTRPVLQSVSAATREFGSCAKMASSTESEIWSDTLSGWPSETDSEVNRNSLFISGNPTVALAAILAKTARLPVLQLKLFLRPLARLSLGANHAVGAFLGRLVYWGSPRYRMRVLDNLAASGLAGSSDDVRRLAKVNAAEIGKGATELVWALFRPIDEVAATVVARVGWEAVEKLREAGRPIIFVTPHLGSYDIAGRYLWTHLPILAMYRPHKLFWLDQMMREGRNRGAAPDGSNTAPATLAGVRMVLKHLARRLQHRAPRPGARNG